MTPTPRLRAITADALLLGDHHGTRMSFAAQLGLGLVLGLLPFGNLVLGVLIHGFVLAALVALQGAGTIPSYQTSTDHNFALPERYASITSTVLKVQAAKDAIQKIGVSDHNFWLNRSPTAGDGRRDRQDIVMLDGDPGQDRELIVSVISLCLPPESAPYLTSQVCEKKVVSMPRKEYSESFPNRRLFTGWS
ncbi:hypothetical protein F5Y18DRAFT_244766 [Xylariaceae sp. FL1019]|nr:hypothetical protein F5Y18DRAFT_244766 [Xylariaceae sp. FL1019]